MFKLFKKKSIDETPLLSDDTPSIEEEKVFLDSLIKHYEECNYKVWKHTDSEEQKENNHINIIAKKSREIILIHCYNKRDNIDLKEVKEFEKQRDKFIEENPIFQEYDIQLRYSLKGFFLTEDAFWYIQEHAKFISYEVIK